MNLITGRAGVAHITPRQDAMWHQGLIEMESCIFDAYENFAAEIITNNEVRIRSGVGMLKGRFFCIEPNTYDSADIANGNQGEYRKDLIVARITVDASTNTQSASIEVIQGTPAAENPTAPEATVGDLDAGDLIADYPLVEVLLNGINIESLTPVFNTGWLFNGAGRQKLNFIGINPIASVAEDTVANWLALGTGIASYDTAGLLINQPQQYGTVFNMVSGNNVRQMWFNLAGGNVYHRGGNQNGWNHTWRKMLDETNGIQMVKLWENASPTSDFVSQNILVSDFDDYDIFFVEYKILKSAGSTITGLVTKGQAAVLTEALNAESSSTNVWVRRIVYADSTNKRINFNDATSKSGLTGTPATANRYLIPTKIYGIKGVQ